MPLPGSLYLSGSLFNGPPFPVFGLDLFKIIDLPCSKIIGAWNLKYAFETVLLWFDLQYAPKILIGYPLEMLQSVCICIFFYFSLLSVPPQPREFPGCGNIITFAQFLFIAMEGFIFEAKFGSKRPAIPIR